MVTKETLAAVIDHTLLRADATPTEIDALCAEAADLRTATVCVNPLYVPRCVAALAGTSVGVCTVVGFPLGASDSAVKAYETARAVEQGAAEIDMVLSVGLLKAGEHSAVRADIAGVVAAARERAVKVILETCLLSEDEIVAACGLCRDAGAHFVKTSTGFGARGATAEHVRLMKASAGGLLVKAAGGIRTTADALSMLDAGADRLGCSRTAEILAGLDT